MIDTAQLSADLAAIVADLPGQITFGELVIPARFSSLNRAERMTMTGNIETLDFRAIFSISSLNGGTHPKDGDKIVAAPPGLATANCKVGAVIYPQGGVSIILELSIDRRNPFPAAAPE